MTGGLPLFPLGTVLFPGVVLPLHVFEPRYRTLVRHLMDQPEGEAREFGVVAIRRGWEVGGQDDSLYEIGCTAELKQVRSYEDGRFDIVSVGRRRFRLRDVDRTAAPYLCGDVDWLPEQAGTPGFAERLAPSVLAAFRRYLELLAEADGGDTEQAATVASDQLPDDPAVLSHLVATAASLPIEDRQRLLGAADTASRLRAELSLLGRETALLRELRAVPVPLSELRVESSLN